MKRGKRSVGVRRVTAWKGVAGRGEAGRSEAGDLRTGEGLRRNIHALKYLHYNIIRAYKILLGRGGYGDRNKG